MPCNFNTCICFFSQLSNFDCDKEFDNIFCYIKKDFVIFCLHLFTFLPPLNKDCGTSLFGNGQKI